MPANEPRQHHVLPVAYLAGFTDTGEADGTLRVFDYLRNKRYTASPRRVSREKDFYRVRVPGQDEFAVERSMAALEDELTPYLKEVVRDTRMLSKVHLGRILSLAALIAARDKRMRANMRTVLAQSLKEHLATGKIQRAKYERIRASELAAGADPTRLPDYDRARELALQSGWMPPSSHVVEVGLIPELQESILGYLMNRRWELMHSSQAVLGGFVASDSPLVWGLLEEVIATHRSAPLTHETPEITFPLSKRLALVSYSAARSITARATKRIVGHVNLRTLQVSAGLVFHAEPDFLLAPPGSSKVYRGSDYMAFVHRARSVGIINP